MRTEKAKRIIFLIILINVLLIFVLNYCAYALQVDIINPKPFYPSESIINFKVTGGIEDYKIRATTDIIKAIRYNGSHVLDILTSKVTNTVEKAYFYLEDKNKQNNGKTPEFTITPERRIIESLFPETAAPGYELFVCRVDADHVAPFTFQMNTQNDKTIEYNESERLFFVESRSTTPSDIFIRDKKERKIECLSRTIMNVTPTFGRRGEDLSIHIKAYNTHFSKAQSRVEFFPPGNIETKSDQIRIMNDREMIIPIQIDPRAKISSYSMSVSSTIESVKEEVLADNSFSVTEPVDALTIKQKGETVITSLVPEEDVIVEAPMDVYLQVKVTPEGGKIEERKRPIAFEKRDQRSFYDLGTFSGGDIVDLTAYRGDAIEDKQIVVPQKTMKVRPAPVSLRTGVILVSRLSKVRTPVSVFARFARMEDELMGTFGWGYGFGVSVENDPRVYTMGFQFELHDLVDIT
jgi:hypothetical protein